VTPAYGGIYSTGDTITNILAGIYLPLVFPGAASAASNVIPDTAASALTIDQAGIYLISYNTDYSTSGDNYVTTAVTANGAPVAGTVLSQNTTGGQVESASNGAITACLPAGTVLRLAASAIIADTLYLPASGTTLQVVRVG
jgi:hypothetical protein